MEYMEIRHAHLFCGLGGGAKGFNNGRARYGNIEAKFRCLGGVDVDKAALADFSKLSGVPGTYLDMFDRDQYIAFHGQEPPKDWHEAIPDDLRRAFGYEHPHIGFLSPPCKGLSGLLSESKSRSAKYQALNRLTLRGIWLFLEAYQDDPVELIILENVPRIATRGRHLLDQITALLRSYGYAVAETTHDCGQIGGLAQSRKRFLLVARYMKKVPSYLYEPHKRPLLAVGDILGRMPRPGNPIAGPMHRIPSLQWKTWVRLAFVEAGSDWRSLKKLAVENGYLRDYGIVPDLGPWRDDVLGVLGWEDTSGTLTGKSSPTNGRYAVADPNPGYGSGAHQNIFRIVPWQCSAGTITGASHAAGGALSIADIRCVGWSRENCGHSREGAYGVVHWDKHVGPVVAKGRHDNSRCAVADPLPGLNREKGDNYLTAGQYGVRRWDEPCGAVSASACHDNGFYSVADPALPNPNQKMVCVIRALDGTWHRPFTTLELAALQGLLDPEEQFELDGLSDSAWRERIGNAVPPPAAAAIAGVMGEVLLLTWAGETFSMSSQPIWVKPVAAALMSAQ